MEIKLKDHKLHTKNKSKIHYPTLAYLINSKNLSIALLNLLQLPQKVPDGNNKTSFENLTTRPKSYTKLKRI